MSFKGSAMRKWLLILIVLALGVLPIVAQEETGDSQPSLSGLAIYVSPELQDHHT